MLRWLKVGMVGLLLAIGFGGASATAGERLNALIQETQKSDPSPSSLGLAWWMPTEFWVIALEEGGSFTPAQVDEVKRTLSPYTMFLVVDGTIGPLGGATFRKPEDVWKSTVLTDTAGRKWSPIPENQLPADLRTLMGAMGPMLKSMLGAMGENLVFAVFADKPAGKTLLDATGDGSFSLQVGTTTHNWRLPIGALLPQRSCSACNETLSGAYKFCPYDGTALTKGK
jgi:hypothetical protein